jgi:peptidoglycan/LPS O-acetylase OafA/YrhL
MLQRTAPIEGSKVPIRAANVASPSFVHLDMARGLAALLVLLGHLRGFVFFSYDQLKSHSPLDMAVWAITGFGHQAVMVFFVLSGFFITRSILIDDRKRKFSWPIYLIKRLSRLWIVLIPCILLTLLWDSIGASSINPDFYLGKLYSIYNSGPSLQDGGAHHELTALIGNLFFLQTILVPIFGSNGPLWSLANEFWYYLMFPLLYVAVVRRRYSLVGAVNIIAFFAICIFVGPYIVISGAIWLAGAIVYIVYDRGWLTAQLKHPFVLIAALLAFLFSLAVSKGHYGSDLAKDFFIGLTAAFFVLVVARYDAPTTFYRVMSRILADGSYTMYLVHFPFIAVLAAIFLKNQKFDASIVGYSVFIGLGILTLSYCFAVYWLFERQTGKVRRFCLKKYSNLLRERVPAK